MKPVSWIHIDNEIKQIFQHYYRLHRVRLSVFTPDGICLYPGADQPDCSYCRCIRTSLAMEARCIELDRRMIAKSIREGRMIRYHCHGGMEEAALPLKVDGETIGCIMLGQFRREGSEESPYEEEWRRSIGNNNLGDAFRASPSFSEEHITLLVETYQFLLGLIARERMIRNRDYNDLLPLMKKMYLEPAWNPSLAEAAEITKRSTSSLNRLVTKTTGKSFKAFIIESKISYAERQFEKFPDKTIAEIAAALGYSDPLYFSRIYKRYRGMAPKHRRRQLLHENETPFTTDR